jgi:UDP:flavonoid glycosyltransferase YjiC (YdhE family)
LNESISLHKPVFSVPVRNQYEQILNAWYVRALKYGAYAQTINAPELRAFVQRVPEFSASLASFAHDANAKLFATVQKVLEDFEGRAFHAELRR